MNPSTLLKHFTCVVIIILATLSVSSCQRYEPTWESLDSRPLPTWYDRAKVGIFIHWGVFSVPSFGSEWFWWYWQGDKPYKQYANYVKENFRPDWTYADFAQDFTAQFYDPHRWADIFNASGARYVVQVTKHHEGFTSWPSNFSFNWNAMDVGPNRDLVGELADAIRKKTNLHYGVYHSMFEWFHPLYNQDKENNFTTQNFVNSKTLPELYELVKRYKPDIIWSDGVGVGQKRDTDKYWRSKEFLTWLYNDSPVKDSVVVNDRWGSNTPCKHGGYLTCGDSFNPKTLQKRKFENAFTIYYNSWGYVRNGDLSGYRSIQDVIAMLVQTVSCGGNVLINVGPTKDGVIPPILEERLRQMGSWLGVNGDAIYDTKPWRLQNDTVNPHVWYTQKGDVVYAITLKWPLLGLLALGGPLPSLSTSVRLLGHAGPPLAWTPLVGDRGLLATLPTLTIDQAPYPWGWAFELTNIS